MLLAMVLALLLAPTEVDSKHLREFTRARADMAIPRQGDRITPPNCGQPVAIRSHGGEMVRMDLDMDSELAECAEDFDAAQRLPYEEDGRIKERVRLGTPTGRYPAARQRGRARPAQRLHRTAKTSRPNPKGAGATCR